ncbi:MAG: NosD domain-containing protein [Thermoplasmata archaeon]
MTIDGGGSGTVVAIQANGVEFSGFEIVNGGGLAPDSGISLGNVDQCNIHDNDITGCYNGILISSGCDNNTIENNTILSNAVGANVRGSWNTIFHNNFLNNTNHTMDAGLNIWDMGYPAGGNFFDNWTAPDSNIDGFVDNPFIIPTGGGGGAALDLDNYRIEQYGGSETWYFSAGTSVPPQGYIVIGRLADQASFESFWGVIFGSDVLYINANNAAGSDFLAINGGETFELFDDTSTSIDGPTGYTMVSGNSAQRTATSDDGTLLGSWAVVSSNSATPGSGASGDTTAGLVINEYSDASSYNYEFVELYYDSPPEGAAGSLNQDNWPFTSQDGWLNPPQQSYPLSLEVGWNLVSLPLAQANASIHSVLSPIEGQWDLAYWYDPLDNADHWKSYNMNYTGIQDLTDINHIMGFWLHMTEEAILTVHGCAIGNSSINLIAGWNLVGYPSMTARIAAEALAGTEADIISICQSASPYVLDITDLSTVTMEPGQGYWVHVPVDTVWAVEW